MKLIVLFYLTFILSINLKATLQNGKYVVYWGQNSYGAANPTNQTGWEKNLDEYCMDDSIDILVVSFMHIFNSNSKPTYVNPAKQSIKSGEMWNTPQLNLSCHCNTTFRAFPSLLNCPKISNQIKTCQSKGKKVLLSLGGAAGSYSFMNDADAVEFAKTVWNMFFDGNGGKVVTPPYSITSNSRVNFNGLINGSNDMLRNADFPRPFGDAVLDGVDFDIEGGNGAGWTAFNLELKSYFKKSNKELIIAGAPQCPYPDGYFGEVLFKGWFDYLFIQFYNNFCGVHNFQNPYAWNFKEWNQWAQTKSKNPEVKLFLGVPGSQTAAGSGFLPPEKLKPIVESLKANYSSTFGGVMVWDASQGDKNLGKGSFTNEMSKLVKSPLKIIPKMPTAPKTSSENHFYTQNELKSYLNVNSIYKNSDISQTIIPIDRKGNQIKYKILYQGKEDIIKAGFETKFIIPTNSSIIYHSDNVNLTENGSSFKVKDIYNKKFDNLSELPIIIPKEYMAYSWDVIIQVNE